LSETGVYVVGAIVLLLGGFVAADRSSMQNYRVVPVDDTGKLGRQRSFVCANDDDAIIWAKQIVDREPVELWSGARFIARLEPRFNAKTD